MSVTSGQKVRLGAFVLVSLTLLVGSVAILAGLKIAEVRDEYTVRFEGSVAGLEVGAEVKYNGVRVGRVDSIRIDAQDVGQVVVRLSLDEGTPIKVDTHAVLNLTGITGLRFIELTRGSNASAFLKPGDQIPAGESLLDRLTGQAEAIAQKAEMALNRVNKVLSEDNRRKISGILAGTDELIANVVEVVEENRESVRVILSAAAEASAGASLAIQQLSEDATATMASIRKSVEKLGDAVDGAQVARIMTGIERLIGTARRKLVSADVGKLVDSATALSDRAGRLVTNIDLTVVKSREDLFASLSYLLEGLENFSEFARMIRENPALLLTGQKEEARELP